MKITGKWVLLAGLLAGLLATSCSDNSAAIRRYAIERQYFLADKMVKDAQIRPELNDPQLNSRIRKAYADLLISCYAALDSTDKAKDSVEYFELGMLTYRSGVRLSQMLFAARRYDSCGAVIKKLTATVALPRVESAGAQVLLGQSAQGAGKLDSAIADYRRAITILDPPVSPDGNVVFSVFNVPAQMYRIYQRIGDSTKRRQAFAEAESYYQHLTAGAPGSKQSLAAHAMLARLYGEVGDGRAAIASLEQLKDSTGAVNPDARLTIADIEAAQLLEYDKALALYDDIEKGLPKRDSVLIPILELKKALVLMQQKQYSKARQTLVDMKAKYQYYYDSDPMTQYTMARSFEQEGNFTRAETEYKYLIDKYAGSEQAFSTMLYLAEQYGKQGRKMEADKMLERAEKTFDSAAARGAGSGEEALALTYKAELLRRKEDFRSSAGVLVQIFDKFPDTEVGKRALLTAAAVYREKLKEPSVADSLVNVFVASANKFDAPEQ